MESFKKYSERQDEGWGRTAAKFGLGAMGAIAGGFNPAYGAYAGLSQQLDNAKSLYDGIDKKRREKDPQANKEYHKKMS